MVGFSSRRMVCAIWLFSLVTVAGARAGTRSVLSRAERDDVARRLARFYGPSRDPDAMREVPPKFSLSAGRFGVPAVAGWKASAGARRMYCEQVLRSRFRGLDCEGRLDETAVEANDRVERLTETWLPKEKVITTLDGLPTSGKTSLELWSDDYWRTRFGLTSYRYAGRQHFPSYAAAVASYSQPWDWLALTASLDPRAPGRAIVGWSPAEKYDLSVGDEAFGLTNSQKGEGGGYLENGDVAEWMGICHGWAAASVMVPSPRRSVTLAGPRGTRIEWYPGDIKAMLSLAWGNGITDSNFAGTRCLDAHPSVHPNGRLASTECFDSNPATFHLALGNLVGIARRSFLMDTSFDIEIWNQPIQAYEFRYFDPLDWRRQSDDWRAVAVDYDARFKQSDRFQKPLTRGRALGHGKYDDSGIRKVVGVIATVTYAIELSPVPHQSEAPPAEFARTEYLYDLELHESGGKLVARGGEWLHNAHPDFLWTPRAGSVARSPFDTLELRFTGWTPIGRRTTSVARLASAYGYPLCQPLRKLMQVSNGYRYPCAGVHE